MHPKLQISNFGFTTGFSTTICSGEEYFIEYPIMLVAKLVLLKAKI